MLTPEQSAALRDKAIFIGGGWQDPIHAVGFGSPTPDRRAR